MSESSFWRMSSYFPRVFSKQLIERTRIDFIAVNTNSCTRACDSPNTIRKSIHERTQRSVFTRTQAEFQIRISGFRWKVTEGKRASKILNCENNDNVGINVVRYWLNLLNISMCSTINFYFYFIFYALINTVSLLTCLISAIDAHKIIRRYAADQKHAPYKTYKITSGVLKNIRRQQRYDRCNNSCQFSQFL